MTKKAENIKNKIYNNFSECAKANTYTLEITGEKIYSFNKMQDEAFKMLSAMLHFDLLSDKDFKELWEKVLDLGRIYDYTL